VSDPAFAADPLRAQLASGARWTLGAHLARQGLYFALQIVLARLLAPEAFGRLAMVLVFSGFASLWVDLGFGPALVQAPRLEPRHLHAVWWLTAAVGAALGAAVALAAPAVAAFYADPALVAVVRLVALQIVLAALAVVPGALLARGLRFRALGAVETLASAAAGVLAVTLALRGHGALALAAQLVAAAGLAAVGLHAAARFRPRLHFDPGAIRELAGFSGYLVGYRVFEYWVRNADKLLIGRVVGSAGLGLYGRAYQTMLLPVSQIGDVAGRVMFPALARLRADAVRSKALYLRAVRTIALVSFPAMAGLWVVADDFVLAVFGPAWTDAAPLLRVLAWVGLMQSIGTSTGWIYRAQARTDWQFRFGLVTGATALLAFAVGIRFGVMGVAWAYLLRNLALTGLNFSIPGRLIGLRWREVLGGVAPVLACALGMAAAVAMLGLALPPGIPAPLRLAAEAGFGAAAYGGLLLAFRPRAWREGLELAAELLGRPPAAPGEAPADVARA